METAKKRRQLDMLHGPIWNKIPQFALPVAATAILGQLFNAADVAVVGNFAGEMSTASVAAVGANSAIIGLIVNLFIGISLGANVTIAHAVGQGDHNAVRKAVHTAIVMSVLGGLIAAALGEAIAAPLLSILNVPEDVFPLAVLYLRIYLAGLPVILLYNFEAAIFRSVGETKTPLIALTASGVLNVVLNLFFVAVLDMTVDGVALATVVERTDNLYEYTPMQIKQAVTGYGGADKHQVQLMVKMLLGMKDIARPDDAADALAVALTHANSMHAKHLFKIQ